MAEKLNIHQKLLEARKTVTYLQKENEGKQYKFVGSSQVLNAIRAKLDELGLLLVPRVTKPILLVVDRESNGRMFREYFTELEMTFTWVNADAPDQTIECPWYGQGLDTGEKGVGKALTYAEKYFILKFFNIATDKDDPDAFQERHEDKVTVKPKAAPKPKPELDFSDTTDTDHKRIEVLITNTKTDREKFRLAVKDWWKKLADKSNDPNNLPPEEIHFNDLPKCVFDYAVKQLEKKEGANG